MKPKSNNEALEIAKKALSYTDGNTYEETVLANEVVRLSKKLSMIQEVVNEQANDESLWCVNLPGDEENWITIGEAYMQQALRRLHEEVEK